MLEKKVVMWSVIKSEKMNRKIFITTATLVDKLFGCRNQRNLFLDSLKGVNLMEKPSLFIRIVCFFNDSYFMFRKKQIDKQRQRQKRKSTRITK